MRQLVVLYPPPPDPDAFRRYYEETHVPLVHVLPGLVGFRYAFDAEAIGGDSPYFCVAELDYEDDASLAASFASPEGKAAVADVANFATEPVLRLVLEMRETR